MTDIGVDNISTKNVKVSAPEGQHWWCLEFNEDTQLAEIEYVSGYDYSNANEGGKKIADATIGNCLVHFAGKRLYGKIKSLKIHTSSPAGHITARRAK